MPLIRMMSRLIKPLQSKYRDMGKDKNKDRTKYNDKDTKETSLCFLLSSFSVILQVPILTNSDCQLRVLANETIQDSMLCAGGEGRGTNKVGWNLDLCFSTHSQGDSGGPLTVEEDGIHTLAGITSHGLSKTPDIKVDT